MSEKGVFFSFLATIIAASFTLGMDIDGREGGFLPWWLVLAALLVSLVAITRLFLKAR